MAVYKVTAFSHIKKVVDVYIPDDFDGDVKAEAREAVKRGAYGQVLGWEETPLAEDVWTVELAVDEIGDPEEGF